MLQIQVICETVQTGECTQTEKQMDGRTDATTNALSPCFTKATQWTIIENTHASYLLSENFQGGPCNMVVGE